MKIAQFYCTLRVENLNHNLFMHTDKCEMERINCHNIHFVIFQCSGTRSIFGRWR